MAKKENVSVVTPTGVAIYPHLNRPDVYKDPNTGVEGKPEYKVSLSLTQEEAAPIIEKIEAVKQQAMALIPAGKKQKEADDPYFNELDDEKQETGRIIIKFKMKAEYVRDGRTVTMSPKLFDAQGTLMSDCDDIWGGSKIKVSADLIPWYMAGPGAGVSMRLKAVQIIELKTGGGASASSYGFDSTEGYTAPEETAPVNDFSNDDEDF